MLDAEAVATLVDAMREQWKVLQDLVDIGDKKTQVLIEGKLPELDVLVKGEQALLVQLNRLEGKRLERQQVLAERMGAVPEDLTLSRLMAEAPFQEAATLVELQASYQTTVARLNAQQQTNSELIQQAMQYVNFSLQMITGATAQVKTAGTYTAQGQHQGANGTRPIKRMDGRA